MSWFRRRRDTFVLRTTIDPRSIPPAAQILDPAGAAMIPSPRPWDAIQHTCGCGVVSYHPQSCSSVRLRFRDGVLVRLDDCGVCDLVPTVSGYVRGVQVSCPVHGDTDRERSRAEPSRATVCGTCGSPRYPNGCIRCGG